MYEQNLRQVLDVWPKLFDEIRNKSKQLNFSILVTKDENKP